ncbi:hypothetical protein NDU88_002143 [Pleurodeles waltl]|uniref:Uncharacterized protein n=1 Tax=Pleurodeles waltl TaxID=8319 RepID=A0AAV7RB43_PLEWA|nr:hypothetical protein NDU88_002143 [Pleurodeles waltl]
MGGNWWTMSMTVWMASSGGGALALEQEGAATHLALEGEAMESEATSGMEGAGSSTVGTGADSSDSDSSSDGSSLVVAGTSVPTSSTGLPKSQPSTSATTSPGTVVPATAESSSVPPIRAASVPRSEGKDIPPPAKVKKVPTSQREKQKQPATKGSAKTKGDSGKTTAAPSRVGKGQKQKSRSEEGMVAPTEGPVSHLLSMTTPTCTAENTASCPPPQPPPAPPPARLQPQRQSPASSPVASRPRLQETSCFVPQQVLTHAPLPAPPLQIPPQAPPLALWSPRTLAPPLTWLPSPVDSRLRLEVSSWTLGSFHEA